MKGINFNSKQIQLLIEIKRKEIRFQFIHHVCHKRKKKIFHMFGVVREMKMK